jgi:hypothetical protein
MKMPKEQAEKALRIWAQERGRIAAQRDPLVQDAYVSGVNKHQIHILTGLARTTVDDILKIYDEEQK